MGSTDCDVTSTAVLEFFSLKIQRYEGLTKSTVSLAQEDKETRAGTVSWEERAILTNEGPGNRTV